MNAFEFMINMTATLLEVLWKCVVPYISFKLMFNGLFYSFEQTVLSPSVSEDESETEPESDLVTEGNDEQIPSSKSEKDLNQKFTKESMRSLRKRVKESIDVADMLNTILFGTFSLPRIGLHRYTNTPNLPLEATYLLTILVIHGLALYNQAKNRVDGKEDDDDNKEHEEEEEEEETKQGGSLTMMERMVLVIAVFCLIGMQSFPDSVVHRFFLSWAIADYFRCMLLFEEIFGWMKHIDASRWAMRIALMYPVVSESFSWTRVTFMIIWTGCVMIPRTPLPIFYVSSSIQAFAKRRFTHQDPVINTKRFTQFLLLPNVQSRTLENSIVPSTELAIMPVKKQVMSKQKTQDAD